MPARSSAPAMARAPRSTAGTCAIAPPNLPIAVRAAEAMTERDMGSPSALVRERGSSYGRALRPGGGAPRRSGACGSSPSPLLATIGPKALFPGLRWHQVGSFGTSALVDGTRGTAGAEGRLAPLEVVLGAAGGALIALAATRVSGLSGNPGA